MPRWDVRKFSLTVLPLLALLLALAVGTFVLCRRDRLGGDELMAGSFCLGTPLVLLIIAAAFAIYSERHRRIGEPGYCPRCGEWLSGEDAFCPQCGSSAAAWAVPPRMKSDRARDVTAERPVGRRRKQLVTVQLATEATMAAKFIVEQSLTPPSETAALTAECMENEETVKRLYHVAARRLHPDRNDGVQSDAWNRLQDAMDVMKAHHGE